VGLASWRFLVGHNPSRRAFALYLATTIVGCAFIGAAAFFGGEMLHGHKMGSAPSQERRRIYHVITRGIKGEMPSFAKTLNDDIRALTVYLGTFRT
jgi:hypothetical protein